MSVTTVGFKEFERKLRNLEPNIKRSVNGFVEDAALLWEERAKLSAPVNTGFLRGNISSTPAVNLRATVVSAIKYSPYVEWGTGTRVQVPVELASYAIQFKGIKQVIGMFPKPYFFIQKPFVEKQLFADVKTYLETPQ